MSRSRRHKSATTLEASPAKRLVGLIGGAGAALAFAIQFLLPFFAMTPVAAASTVPAISQVARDGGVLCSEMTSRDANGRAPSGAHHLCPICWAMQQAFNLMPPEPKPLAAPTAVSLDFGALPAAADFAPHFLPPVHPRGPPLA